MTPPEEVTFDTSADVCAAVLDRIEEAVVVDRAVLREVLAAVLARGHVLLEDVPGTGKSVMARVLAESLGLGFNRLQFTPDLLPADVTGSNVYNEHERTFEFAEGPVFTNVVLADEINRAPPKTQAALLEAMEERQVSVDGTTHDLPVPFFVVATQNPVEQEGTFRLPEAQRDRFSVKTSIGYPDTDGEMGLLERRANRRTLAPSVDPVVDAATVEALQDLAEEVTVEEKVRRYIVDVASETRADTRTEIGVSPRGVQRVFELARAMAVIEGRDYVAPDDVKRLAQSAMTHRVVLTTEATVEGVDPAAVVGAALDRVEIPGVSPDAPAGEAPRPPDSADGPGANAAGDGQGATAGNRTHGGRQPQGERQPQGGQQPQGGKQPQGRTQSPGSQQPQGDTTPPPEGGQPRGNPDAPRDGQPRGDQPPRGGHPRDESSRGGQQGNGAPREDQQSRRDDQQPPGPRQPSDGERSDDDR